MSLSVGCAGNPKAKRPAEVTEPAARPGGALISNTDPSAMKLHDIEGAILMYFAINKTLPVHLEDALPLGGRAD